MARAFEPKRERDPIERLDPREDIERLPGERPRSKAQGVYETATNPKTKSAIRKLRGVIPKAEEIPVRPLTRSEWFWRAVGCAVAGGLATALAKARWGRPAG